MNTVETLQAKVNELVREAYELGRSDGIIPNKKQPQLVRDEIVAEAKRDITGLIPKDPIFQGKYYRVKGERNTYICFVEFIVNREKRTVVALMRGWYKKSVYAKGIAKCRPEESFNVHIGKAIALRRALGETVPDEYLNAPQPEGFKPGDVVKLVTSILGTPYERKIADIGDRHVEYTPWGQGHDSVTQLFTNGTVIDDSDRYE